VGDGPAGDRCDASGQRTYGVKRAMLQLEFLNAQGLWFTYYGLDPVSGKPRHCDAQGNAVPSVPSEKPTEALSFPVTGSLPFPMLSAARLYLSDKPLWLTVDQAGNAIPPRPQDPQDLNYGTRWDFFEVTYVPVGQDGLFNLNLSNVQSAGMPLSFRCAGQEPSTRQPVDYQRGWLSGGYSKFLEAMQANPDFRGLILPERVLAPGTAITAFKQGVIPKPLIDAQYLKMYCDQVWDRFESADLTFVGDPPPGSNTFVQWVGRVQEGLFVFKTSDLPLEPIVLSVPSTQDLFENNFRFCFSGRGAPGSLQENYANQLMGTLCAAFNRSVMLTVQTLANSSDCQWCKDKAGFYQDPITNHYSKEIHANCQDGLAYAFQSDDHCDVSSYVSVINPTLFQVTYEQ